MKVKYTIIIPFFNGSKYIEETIDSTLCQTLSEFEVLIIDDGSSDSELCSLERVVDNKSDNRLKIIKNKENIGLMRTLNVGVSLSKADYIIVLGQDDLIFCDHLLSLDKYVGSSFSMIFCDAYYIYNGEYTNKKVRGSKLDAYKNNLVDFYSLMKWNSIVSTGICINKQLLVKNGGFDYRFKNCGEWVTWLKMSLDGYVLINRDVCSGYRRHDDNITNRLFSDCFNNVYDYYNYVNKCAFFMRMGGRSGLIFLRNLIKNNVLFLYKKVFPVSKSHMVFLNKSK